MDAAEAARKGEDWKTAKALLTSIRQMMQKKLEAGSINADPYIIQQLALATYEADNSVEALKRRTTFSARLDRRLPTTPNSRPVGRDIQTALGQDE
jgi:hypothetical protein